MKYTTFKTSIYSVPVEINLTMCNNENNDINNLINNNASDLLHSVLNMKVFEDESTLDTPIYNTNYWLNNGKMSITYGENDKVLKIVFTGELYNNHRESNKQVINYASAMLEALGY